VETSLTPRSRSRWRSLDAWLLATRALRHVVWVRWALWRWPYARVLDELSRRRSRAQLLAASAPASSGAGVAGRRPPSASLAWAVRAASRRVPRASCLTQALALEGLLAEFGQQGVVRIGVARGPDGTFEAHAWLEHDGRVLIGEVPDMDRFAVMPAGAEPPAMA
jgi:hypothetical protein